MVVEISVELLGFAIVQEIVDEDTSPEKQAQLAFKKKVGYNMFFCESNVWGQCKTTESKPEGFLLCTLMHWDP